MLLCVSLAYRASGHSCYVFVTLRAVSRELQTTNHSTVTHIQRHLVGLSWSWASIDEKIRYLFVGDVSYIEILDVRCQLTRLNLMAKLMETRSL